jgi:hypothetical protein
LLDSPTLHRIPIAGWHALAWQLWRRRRLSPVEVARHLRAEGYRATASEIEAVVMRRAARRIQALMAGADPDTGEVRQ